MNPMNFFSIRNSSMQCIMCTMAKRQFLLKLDPTYENNDMANINFNSLLDANDAIYSLSNTFPLDASKRINDIKHFSSSVKLNY